MNIAHEIVDIYVYIENSERERERERPVLGSWSGMSIIHSGSMSCRANHLRASAPFSFEAWRMSSFFGESEGSGTGSGSSSRLEWRLRKEAKQQAWCWLSRQCCAWCCRESSLRLCWSEIAARLNGRWRSCVPFRNKGNRCLVIAPALFCCRFRGFSNSSTSNCTSDVMLLCRFSKYFFL